MRTGTSHFVSYPRAVKYYSVYESDPVAAVNRRLHAGEIHIGRPPIKPGQRLVMIDNGLRYAIEEEDNE